MGSYIFNRVLIAIPTLIVISVLAFALSKFVPQDPVVALMNQRGLDSQVESETQYEIIYKELGLQKPNFYFSIVPNNYPQSLNSIVSSKERNLTKTLLKSGYKMTEIKSVLASLKVKEQDAEIKKDVKMLAQINGLYYEKSIQDNTMFKSLVNGEKSFFYYPIVYWNGFQNQYHDWVYNFFGKGMGESLVDGENVLNKVKKALKWTLSFTLVDFVLSIILSLWIGYFLLLNPRGRAQKTIKQIMYIIYSVPVFWLATVLVVYFTTDDYGWMTNIFPSVGIDIFPGRSTFTQIALNYQKLILPVLCLTLHSMAYTVRFIERGMMDEMSKDYVQLAFSKGLSKSEVIRKHVLKNSLIPLITAMAKSLAATFGGSLVLEIIFNIPGMGRLMINSIGSADWSVVFCIVMVMSIVTIVSFLIADVLYAYFNPKIRFKRSH